MKAICIREKNLQQYHWFVVLTLKPIEIQTVAERLKPEVVSPCCQEQKT